MAQTVIVREERPDDNANIWRVNEAAFGRAGEADLVNALRQVGAVIASLVAEHDGKIVGHILFTPVTVKSEQAQHAAVALGPMAVLPSYQGQGIGSRLVQAGLAACREVGHNAVFVLGHRDFYPRFGFVTSKPYGIQCEFDVPDGAFMVQALQANALTGIRGVVKYHPEFRKV